MHILDDHNPRCGDRIGQPMSKFWDRVMAKFLETIVGVDPPLGLLKFNTTRLTDTINR